MIYKNEKEDEKKFIMHFLLQVFGAVILVFMRVFSWGTIRRRFFFSIVGAFFLSAPR